ncbi:MAG: M48 family metalloprotease [Candidatus Omnitrophica bacterium]|nr:M48 family metalloprotease [Candidatus Omnitrophota bacterium]
MARLFFLSIAVIVLAGCVTRIDPTRPISKDLPLSYIDLVEIKKGAEEHKEVLKTYKFYNQTELDMYIATIGNRLVAISERPHLPYKFFVLADDRVDIFSVAGGYVYITRGMLEFVNSEAELAAVLAHEVAHVASGAHTPEIEGKLSKKQIFFKTVKLGAAAAAGAAGSIVGGPAGTVAEGAVGGMSDALPSIRKQFQKSEEIEADRKALTYLAKTNYDPRELARFLDKVSTIKISDVLTYINFLNSHPPYEERREEVKEILDDINFKNKNFEVREERFASIRTVTLHFDNIHTNTTEAIAQVIVADPKSVS